MKISRRDFLKKFVAMAAAGTMGLMPGRSGGAEAEVEIPEWERDDYDPGPYCIDEEYLQDCLDRVPWEKIQSPDLEHAGRFIDVGVIQGEIK